MTDLFRSARESISRRPHRFYCTLAMLCMPPFGWVLLPLMIAGFFYNDNVEMRAGWR